MLASGANANIGGWISVKSKRFLAGAMIAVVTLSICRVVTGKWKAGVVFALLFVLLGAIRFKKDALTERNTKILYFAWFLSAAFLTGWITQRILSEKFLTLGALRIVLTACICLVLFLIAYAITLNPKISVCSVLVGLALLSYVNGCVYAFRGTELLPSDILSIQTAGNVAAEYRMVVSNTALYGAILTGAFIFASIELPRYRPTRRTPARICAVMEAGIFIAIIVAFGANIKTEQWMQDGSAMNGFLLNFTLQFKQSFVSKPDTYTPETARNTAEHYRDTVSIADAVTDKPDIIVIMDESFADLSILGSEARTNIEVTPFIDALSENTVRGYALSSVYGGGTPNSEYEFLTGNSMLFLPPGSIVYQQFLKQPSYSMVEELKENGYQCIAMHPYLSSGWERTRVYPYLDFDETHFIEDFPAEDLVRDFVSDREMFEKTVDLYEEKKAAGQDVFLFGVTMQDHGGYVYEGENYQQTVTLEGYEQDYDDAEQYLTLIHETDAAVEYLLDYFSGIEDNVVVVFYGDHLPNLDNRFYEELHGGAFETLDEQQLKYTIPFFIWTNYDIEEETVERTSLNYLSNYVYRAAGFALPEYNEALADVQSLIPAMNANGYYSPAKQAFAPYQEADGKEAELLNFYNQLEYNSLFDEKNRNDILFPIGEQARAD